MDGMDAALDEGYVNDKGYGKGYGYKDFDFGIFYSGSKSLLP